MQRDKLFRVIDRSAGVLLVVIIAYVAIAPLAKVRPNWAGVDWSIMYTASGRIVEAGAYHYPPSFLYPPPAIGMFSFSNVLPKPATGIIWLALTIAASIGTFVLGTSLVGLRESKHRWTLALVAFALTEHYIAWDLRCQNCNMIYCFLLVAALWAIDRSRDRLGGALLALSVSLKLYPALIVGYLAGVRKWRAFAAAVASSLVLFIAMPAVVFGPGNLVGIYRSWFAHIDFMLTAIKAPTAEMITDLPIVAPAFTCKVRLGLDPATVGWITLAFKGIWYAAVAVCLLARRRWWKPATAGWDLAVDGGLLTLAPTIVSPYLESYHVVTVVLLFLALLARLDRRQIGPWCYGLAVAALAIGWMALRASGRLHADPLALRGFGIGAQIVLAVLALAMVRFVTSRSPESETAHGLPAPLGLHRLRRADTRATLPA